MKIVQFSLHAGKVATMEGIYPGGIKPAFGYPSSNSTGIVLRFAIGETVGHEKIDYFLLAR